MIDLLEILIVLAVLILIGMALSSGRSSATPQRADHHDGAPKAKDATEAFRPIGILDYRIPHTTVSRRPKTEKNRRRSRSTGGFVAGAASEPKIDWVTGRRLRP